MIPRVVRGLRRLPRPLLFFAAAAVAAAAATPARAQDPMRPWLDWRTLATPNYRFHFPRELERWARSAAERVESVDSAITSIVGFSTPKPVHVVVDDPYMIANGYALPFLDAPVSVWWASPPDPRNDIGDYRTWYEMLSSHELTHLAHLTRPSRNALRRQLWASLPVNLGPITLQTPRWAFEGYATVVEGRITGSGRPNNAWRPAILRQWAVEGRLPTYGQLSNWSAYNGGEFAYLGGSAFLEWLMRREGDSSLVHVWRRLSARQVRGFDDAFTGVYGDAPAILYGMHVAELTRDAMAARTRLAAAGLVEGELIQRLSWETGDPAVSPDGEWVAITLRDRERPARVVVWSTTPEPEDTAAIRRRIDALKRDPQDVPDRRFYPRPQQAVKTLSASNGRSFQQPRWFADNRRVLVTRWTPAGDGTSSPALYVWDTETEDVTQVTRPAGVSHGDPHPDGKEAVAMRCRGGHCDIVRVDLARGALTTVLAGDPDVSYYRPRYSPDGARFAAAASRDGRWRIVVANRDGSDARVVDPDDGANRYDAQWLAADSLVVVSERGGIPNLEIVELSASTPAVTALTRVTGAAVAPDVRRTDGSIWFLALHSRGLDVRRLARDAPRADSAIAIRSDRFGFAGVQTQTPTPLARGTVAPARAYGSGPRHQRWLPGAYYSGDGAGAFVAVFSGDIVGRFNAVATGAYGERGAWRGGAIQTAWRYPRPALEMGAFGFLHEPSRGPRAAPGVDSLDASLVQAVLAASRERQGDGWRYRARLGGGAGPFGPTLGAGFTRAAGFAEGEFQFQQQSGSIGTLERLRLHATVGSARAYFQRVMASFRFTTLGRDAVPFDATVVAGRLTGAPHPFELFTVGGAAPPIADSAILSQRVPMPEFPTGIATGNRLLAWRVALPAGPWTYFYEGASTATNTVNFTRWNRAIGAEMRYAMAPAPAAFAPRIWMRGGAAYTLDAPFRRTVRVFVEMKYEP